MLGQRTRTQTTADARNRVSNLRSEADTAGGLVHQASADGSQNDVAYNCRGRPLHRMSQTTAHTVLSLVMQQSMARCCLYNQRHLPHGCVARTSQASCVVKCCRVAIRGHFEAERTRTAFPSLKCLRRHYGRHCEPLSGKTCTRMQAFTYTISQIFRP